MINSKVVYNTLVKIKYGQNVGVPKIAQYIETQNEHDGIPDLLWESVYKRAHRCIDTRTRVFQFKFLHDILATNYRLYKWKIRTDAMCEFCREREQDLNHLFWACTEVTRFWSAFREFYCTKLNEPQLTKNMIFLGMQDILLCELIFAAKRHIYKAKVQKVLPSFQSFVREVAYIKEIELQVAKNQNKVHLWTAKWEPLC